MYPPYDALPFPIEHVDDRLYRAKWTDIAQAARKAQPALPPDMQPGMRHTCLHVLGVETWHHASAELEEEHGVLWVLWLAASPDDPPYWVDE